MANVILAQNSIEVMKFYTYIHIRSDNGMVFYVGKGKENRAFSARGRNVLWNRIAKKHGWGAHIFAYWNTEADAFENEMLLIAHYRELGHPLCNMSIGGEGAAGFSPSSETRAKLAAALKGRPRPKEVILKIVRGNTGKKRTPEQNKRNSEARLGKPLPDAAKKALVLALTGKPRSEETKRKIGIGNKGKIITPEHRAIISKSNKGIVRTPEFRAKIVAALTGRPVSRETREKMAARHRGRTIPQEMRDRISKKLKGGKLSEATKEKIKAWAKDPKNKARMSAVRKGKPWSEARRSAQNAKKQSI